MVATPVTGLVIDEIRKMVSAPTGRAPPTAVVPDGVDMSLAPATHHRDQPRRGARLDVAGQHGVQSFEAVLGEPCAGHRPFDVSRSPKSSVRHRAVRKIPRGRAAHTALARRATGR